MQSRTYDKRQHQRGFTLMEILVAVAIFVTVMIIALLLYDQSNRVFKRTNESAEMQQNTRVAFEKVVADVRMAGFDYKRAGTPTATTPTKWAPNRAYSTGTLVTPTTENGHVYRAIDPGTSHTTTEPSWTTGTGDTIPEVAPSTVRWQESGAPIFEQPDEQIEFAHGSAVTLRANFDYDEPGTDNGRETDYQNGNFPVVTTGNDEIVTYALVSQSGTNTDSLSFYADVNAAGTSPKREAYPGGKTEREIKFTGLDFSNSKPPYTLVRITLDDKGNEKRTALADNIRSMTFSYWEDAQATRALTDLDGVAAPNIGGAGAYDPASPNALVKERVIRGKIRAVTVNIVGMNPQPDYDYTNPTETLAAAKNYRQYSLQSTIVGRNLGLEGVPQSSNNPPGPPTFDGVCNGYCGVTVLSWKPDPADTSNTMSYTLYYDKSSSGSFSGVLPVGSQTTYAADLTQLLDEATTYYFKVAATNENGTTVSKNSISVDLRNTTKLAAPVATVVGTGKPNELAVNWNVPSTNTSGTKTCATGVTGQDVYIAEIKGYRVYRSMNPTFNIGDAGVTLLMDENTGGAVSSGTGTWSFIDKGIAACEKYYYRVQVVEWCAANAAYNTTNNVDTGLSAPAALQNNEAAPVAAPRAPTNLKVHIDSACIPDENVCYPVILTWDPVTKDVNNNDIVVLDYQIDRKKKLKGITLETSIDHAQIQDGTTVFTESEKIEYSEPVSGEKYSYEYSVYALHEYAGATPCDKKSSAAVINFPDACATGATLKADASGGTGDVNDPWTDVTGIQVYEGPKPILSVETSLDGGNTYTNLPYPYLYAHTDIGDGLKIPVTFRINVAGCTEVITAYIQNDEPSCLLVGSVVNNSSSSSTVLDIDIKSTATEVITISTIDITWDSQSGVAWNSISLPSNTNHTATGTAAAARTVTFTPTGADKTIAVNGTYKVRMNMSGTALPYGFKVSNVVVKYTVPSTGTVPHNCTLRLTRCSVTTFADFVNNFRVDLPITNDSTEQLTLTSYSINWAGQDKLRWDTITLPSGAVQSVTTANISGTQSFTAPASDDTIDAKGIHTIQMNFSKTNGNPSINETTVGAVWLTYTTPATGSTTLTCRAK